MRYTNRHFTYLLTVPTWYTNRQKQSKDIQNSKNDNWCTNRHITTESAEYTKRRPVLDPLKFKMKIVKSPYLNEKSSDFDEIWYTTANLELDDTYMTKCDFFLDSRWWMGAI